LSGLVIDAYFVRFRKFWPSTYVVWARDQSLTEFELPSFFVVPIHSCVRALVEENNSHRFTNCSELNTRNADKRDDVVKRMAMGNNSLKRVEADVV